ncbi:MAG: nucleotidyltransferase family protein [Actinobacteria bacterium]|nr:nucleotidyltransferase family protein [Actinomycetota bacterium]
MGRGEHTEWSHPRISGDLLARARERRSALIRDRVDEVTAEVLPALARGDIRAILLKGPAIAGWLYERDERRYADSDLLVAPADLEPAGRVLEGLGFECTFDERDFLADSHAQMWSRPRSPEVDLHWRLPGVHAESADAWRVLSAGTERLAIGAVDVETLDAARRALHVALHAAYHQRGGTNAQRDLETALERLPRDVWVECAALARRLEAEAAVGAGLRVIPRGAALADELGLTREGEGYWALAGGRADPGAHGVNRVMSAGSPIRALGVLARELFPPASYIRAVAPRHDIGTGSLASAYARRLFRGLRNAPRAIRTALRARRRVSAAPPP